MAWRPTWNEPPQGDFRRRRPLFARRGHGKPISAVHLLLVLNILAFIAQLLFQYKEAAGFGRYRIVDPLVELGGLSVEALMRLQLWRLVTFQFLHGGVWHIFMNMLVLVFIGRKVEGKLGRKQFLWMYLVCGVAGGLFQCAFSKLLSLGFADPRLVEFVLARPTVGASAGVLGVLAAFATAWPNTILYVFIYFFPVPIKAKWLAIILALLFSWTLYGNLMGTTPMGSVADAAHLGGMILAFIWMRYGEHIAASSRTNRGYAKAGRRERRREDGQEEIDRILRKIHERGIGSLTSGERMFLQRMSRQHYEDDD